MQLFVQLHSQQRCKVIQPEAADLQVLFMLAHSSAGVKRSNGGKAEQIRTVEETISEDEVESNEESAESQRSRTSFFLFCTLET